MRGFLQFDFAVAAQPPRRFTDPKQVVVAWQADEVAAALRKVQAAVDGGLYAAGFIAYEAAPAFDAAMAVGPRSDLPLVWFGLYEGPQPVDETGMSSAGYGETCASTADFLVGDWTCPVAEPQFRAEIAAIRGSIAAGDVYQVNHTVRMRAPFEGDAFAWYRKLRSAQRGAYSAYLDIGRFQILSLSPELFFSVDASRARAITPPTGEGASETPDDPAAGTVRQAVAADPSRPLQPLGSGPGRMIITRPMKGTHPRGRWLEEDQAYQQRLRASEKDRAENIMIVDLLRNDLGRIAETGSVRVDDLFRVERYPTLLQMTSAISARLHSGVGLPEILTALFPCGSVTGAPKIAAMRRISELEAMPRGVYCGTIGYMEPGGRMVFSVAIRTVRLDRETNVAEYGVGSGVTWDSVAETEYAENRLKAAVLRAEAARPDLFETLRLCDGAYSRLGRHLDRILASADFFGIPADEGALREALDRQARERPTGLWRVRLRLSSDGRCLSECEPLEESAGAERTFALHPDPVDRESVVLFHKVADRAAYQRRKAEMPHADEVLLQNRQGELTEFATGNLVLELDGEHVTPPLDCGLLPGVFRAELLEAGVLRERVLTAADLDTAARIWLINSLRGWVPMSRLRLPPR